MTWWLLVGPALFAAEQADRDEAWAYCQMGSAQTHQQSFHREISNEESLADTPGSLHRHYLAASFIINGSNFAGAGDEAEDFRTEPSEKYRRLQFGAASRVFYPSPVTEFRLFGFPVSWRSLKISVEKPA